MKRFFLFTILALFCFSAVSAMALPDVELNRSTSHPVAALVGEDLSYDVSFLTFDRLAVGTIQLTKGTAPETYLAVLEVETRGFAAFVTKDRVERFQTLMEIGPDGLLRPLVHSSHSLKGKGNGQREKITTYTFDYAARQVRFQKIKDHVIHDEVRLPLETAGPVFDILSAFYNLRSGTLGPLDGEQIILPTFHRKGVEQIVIAPVDRDDLKDDGFFALNSILRKVLVDPEIFKTGGRDLLISFDAAGRPQRAVVRNVIGLGDVKGVLRQVRPVLNASN